MSTKLASQAAVESLNTEAALTILSIITWDGLPDLGHFVAGYVAACKATPAKYCCPIARFFARLPERCPARFNRPYGSRDLQDIRDLLNDNEDHEISPKNPYLIVALVSGSCGKSFSIYRWSAQSPFAVRELLAYRSAGYRRGPPSKNPERCPYCFSGIKMPSGDMAMLR
ncbi:hypothetical protein C8J56DRAFT_1072560 [Mycena floridula]|nr:hypothetical protein C8J56DRAFT_1072560 [Mycena floridula]